MISAVRLRNKNKEVESKRSRKYGPYVPTWIKVDPGSTSLDQANY